MNFRRSSFFPYLSLASLAPVAVYSVKAMVPLVVVALLGCKDFASARSGLMRLLASPFGIALAGLLGWSLVSALWSPDSAAAGAALRLALLSFLGLGFVTVIDGLDDGQIKVAATVVAVAALVMLGFFALEYLTDGKLTRLLLGRPMRALNPIGRGTAILAVVAWPVAAILAARMGKAPAAAYLAVAFGVTYLLPQGAAKLAFVTGVVVFAATALRPRAALIALGALIAALTLTAPMLARDVITLEKARQQGIELPLNHRHRLAIWTFTAEKTMHRPVIGHGFDAARVFGQKAVIESVEKGAEVPFASGLLPLHPHNAVLQVWLELGLVGALCLLAMLLGILRAIRRWGAHGYAAPAAAASLTAFLTVASLSFGAWQNWWLACAWVGAGVLVLASRVAAPPPDCTAANGTMRAP